MLSSDEELFLTWLDQQPHPMSLDQMKESSAPGYTWQRVDRLNKDGFLLWQYGFYRGAMVAVYTVSDRGRALLSELENKRHKEAEEKRQQRFQNKVSIAQVLVPAVTFLLGLLTEHFSGILGRLLALF